SGLILFLTNCGVAAGLDEDHAIRGMISIRKAQTKFKSTYGRYGTLDELAAAKLAVPSPVEYGYQFTVRPASQSYVAVAVPLRWKTQSFSLYLDESGIIRGMFRDGAEAN